MTTGTTGSRMHEMGLVGSVIDIVTEAMKDAPQGARVRTVTLKVGDMTETVADALDFAFEALAPGTVLEGATLVVDGISPRSRCLECGHEYGHDRFQMQCPACGSYLLELLCGRELEIASIDVDEPEDRTQKE